MKHVPLLNLKITLFNKEEGLDDKEKETEILLENFHIKLPSKLYNIKVNLYEYYPEKLEKYFKGVVILSFFLLFFLLYLT